MLKRKFYSVAVTLTNAGIAINGITFKLTKTKLGEYEGVCLNPKNIPPDDLDDVILGRGTGGCSEKGSPEL